MKKQRILNTLLVAAALGLTGCNQQGGGSGSAGGSNVAVADNSKVLASVNGEKITENMLKHVEKTLGVDIKETPDMKNTIVNEMIKRKLLADFAKKQGMDKTEDFRMTMDMARESALVESALKSLQDQFGNISDEEIKARYDKEIAGAASKEYKVSHILVDSEEKARELIKKLKDGADFAETARKESTGPSNKRGGDLGWIRKGMVVPEFYAGMENLKKGEITPEPVKTKYGWHVIKVEDERETAIAPFDSVKEKIKGLILQERLQAKLDELKSKAKIDVPEN